RVRERDAARRPAAAEARIRRVSRGAAATITRVALPLSVRADGPPRAAAQVPGIRPRRGLVRRQPARADGRLLPDVRRGLQGRRARGLPAVPDGRAGRLDLLLAVPAERRAGAAGPG